MYTYEKVEQEFGFVIKRTDDDGNILWIPMAPENSDYQAYLEHEATSK